MKKSTTRRALILSILSLIMCASMLVGTTFAWFTDTVTSGNNKIQSGTLDIELWMADENGNYSDISASSDPIFSTKSNKAQNVNSDTLWEPGKTQVAYLYLKNAGNLALKYTVGLKVTEVTKNLNEVMSYKIIPDAQAGSVTAWSGNGNKVTLGTQSVSGTVSMLPGDVHYFALAIHMDEEAGNEYQDASITFDLAVLATQFTYESDSFDDQYDKDAKYDEWSPVELKKEYKTTPAANEPTVDPNGAQTPAANDIVDENGNAIDPDEELTHYVDLKETDVISGNKTFTYEINVVDENGNKVKSNGVPFIVPVEVGAGLGDFSINHKGVAMKSENSYAALDAHNEFYYDFEKGILYIATCDFSPFEVTVSQYSTVEMSAFAAAVAGAKEGDTVTLNLTTDAYVAAGKKIVAPAGVNVVINGNGHTVYCDNAQVFIAVKQNSDLTINDVTVIGSTTDDAIISQNNGVGDPVTIVMNKVTVNLDSIKGINWPVCFGGKGAATLTDCTITGAGLNSGDYADGNVFFAGAEMDVTLVNTKLDNAMLNGSKGGNSATMKLDLTSSVGLVYLEAKDASVISGNVAGVKATYIPNNTAAEVMDALNAGANVTLSKDMVLGATDQVLVAGNVLDGNGKTLDATASKIDGMECALNTKGGTIKNLTITGPNARALGSGSNNVVEYVGDLYIDNVTIDNTYYALNGSVANNRSVFVTNSAINGWCSYAGLDLFSFKNCTLAAGNTTCSYDIGYLVVYGDTLIEDCTFDTFYMGVNKGALKYASAAKEAGTPFTLTINNSYYNTADGQVKVTADNFKTLLTDGNDATDFGRLLDNVVITVDGVVVE